MWKTKEHLWLTCIRLVFSEIVSWSSSYIKLAKPKHSWPLPLQKTHYWKYNYNKSKNRRTPLLATFSHYFGLAETTLHFFTGKPCCYGTLLIQPMATFWEPNPFRPVIRFEPTPLTWPPCNKAKFSWPIGDCINRL